MAGCFVLVVQEVAAAVGAGCWATGSGFDREGRMLELGRTADCHPFDVGEDHEQREERG